MKALLDTHTFLWSIVNDERLSLRAKQVFSGPSDLWFSVASIWEIIIKTQTGKLLLPEPCGPYIVGELLKNRIAVLPIKMDHVLRIEGLELHHRDPFDRILIAQSVEERLPIVTADPAFQKYPVELIW